MPRALEPLPAPPSPARTRRRKPKPLCELRVLDNLDGRGINPQAAAKQLMFFLGRELTLRLDAQRRAAQVSS